MADCVRQSIPNINEKLQAPPDFGGVSDPFQEGLGCINIQGSAPIALPIELTPPLAGQASTAWYSKHYSMSSNWRVSFTFSMTEPGTTAIADGIVFAVQGNSNILPASGTGGTLGYGGVSNILAVEFDSFGNGSPVFDPIEFANPDPAHIAITTSPFHDTGLLSNFYLVGDFGVAINAVTVAYANGIVTVTYNGSQILSATVDAAALVGAAGWFGFFGTTGGVELFARQTIHSWQIEGTLM
ncbi:MAG: hypothetical protein F6K62_19350 [Sphaerospermopsis sp. SIO1G2]|nr:hypothetical protein [Sphaerospermopsis sp. SIO1G2]